MWVYDNFLGGIDATSSERLCTNILGRLVDNNTCKSTDLSVKDAILLLGYVLGPLSRNVVWSILKWRQVGQNAIKSRLTELVRDGYVQLFKIQLFDGQTGQEHTLPVPEYCYSLTDAGLKYLKQKYGLPIWPSWMHTKESRIEHDYQNTLCMLQLTYARLKKNDESNYSSSSPYFPSPLTGKCIDAFSKEYMLDRDYFYNRQHSEMYTSSHLVTDSVYTIVSSSQEKPKYRQDRYSALYTVGVIIPNLVEKCAPDLPVNVFVEVDMRTERNPVLLAKIENYAELKSYGNAYPYNTSPLLFACYDYPAIPKCNWLLSNRTLDALQKAVEDSKAQGIDLTISKKNTVLEEANGYIFNHLDLSKIKNVNAQDLENGCREIVEFYASLAKARRVKVVSLDEILAYYRNEKDCSQLSMLEHTVIEYNEERCIKRMEHLIKKLYFDYEEYLSSHNLIPSAGLYAVAPAQCFRILRAFMDGMHCYFLPTPSLWKKAETLYHDPDMIAWVVNTYFCREYRHYFGIADSDAACLQVKVYSEMPARNDDMVDENGKMIYMRPYIDNGLYFTFTNTAVVSCHDKLRYPNALPFAIVVEDLADMGAWVRLKEFARFYKNGDDYTRFICLFDNVEQINSFIKISGINCWFEDDNTIDALLGMVFVDKSVYRKLRKSNKEQKYEHRVKMNGALKAKMGDSGKAVIESAYSDKFWSE